jgi:hypothetical protein
MTYQIETEKATGSVYSRIYQTMTEAAKDACAIIKANPALYEKVVVWHLREDGSGNAEIIRPEHWEN